MRGDVGAFIDYDAKIHYVSLPVIELRPST